MPGPAMMSGAGMLPGSGMVPGGGGMMPGMMPSIPGMAGLPCMVPGAMPGVPQASLAQPPPPPTPPPGAIVVGDTTEAVPLPPPAAVPPPEPEGPALDPEVKKFCDHFEIEPDYAKSLDEEMAKRPDTKASDLAQLYDILDDVGDPSCLLGIKISDMASGEFVGKILEDREAMALALNYGLRDEATQKLYELVSRRATKKGEDLVRMESLLEYAQDKSSTAIRFVGQVLNGEIERLPDLSEAQDVIKKFDLDAQATKKLVEIVLARTEDSSALLGGLEVYFEHARNASSSLMALAGRLLSGGDVPDPSDPREERRARGEFAGERERERSRDRERERERERPRERSRSRDRQERKQRKSPSERRKKSPSRSKRKSRSRSKKRSRSKSRSKKKSRSRSRSKKKSRK